MEDNLNRELHHEQLRLQRIAADINGLLVPPEWKAILFKMVVTRGIRSVKDILEDLEDIAINETPVVKELCLEKKLVGIKTIREVAVKFSDKCQREFYAAVLQHGAKSKEAKLVISKCKKGEGDATLFDFYED